MDNRSLAVTGTPSSQVAKILPQFKGSNDLNVLIQEWQDRPVGFGQHGTVVQFVESVRSERIWFNHSTYCWSEGEGDTLNPKNPDPVVLANLIAKYDKMVIRNEESIIIQTLPIPLVVIDRRNPKNPQQDLMLIWHLPPFIVATKKRALGEWMNVPVIIKPDMPDGDVRLLGIYLRSDPSILTATELVRQARLLQRDAERGQISADLAPQVLSAKQLAGQYNCDRSLVSKVDTTVAALGDNEYYLERRISDKLASRLASLLSKYPEELEALIIESVDNKYSVSEAEKRAREILLSFKEVETSNLKIVDAAPPTVTTTEGFDKEYELAAQVIDYTGVILDYLSDNSPLNQDRTAFYIDLFKKFKADILGQFQQD